jgi:hypothetical protein
LRNSLAGRNIVLLHGIEAAEQFGIKLAAK